MASDRATYRVRRVDGAGQAEAPDALAVEEPLEVRIAGRGVSITMRTPGHDEELVLGFLVGEGVLRRKEEVERVRRCDRAEGEMVEVLVAPGVAVDFAGLTRHVFATSSCGVCGSATLEAVRRKFPRVSGGARVSGSALQAMAGALRERQALFDATGGVHGVGLFGADGACLVVREDVGRHNAVDKVVGWAMVRGMLPLGSSVLVVSGRASFEIVQKAAAAGIPVVAAVSAPSSLAVDLAEEAGVTLVGFLRPGRFNVYAHGERVV